MKDFHLGRSFWVLCLSLLLLLSQFIFSIPVYAEVVPIRIASYQITTLDNKSVTNQVLMAGGSYKIQFTLEIAAGLKERGVLKTGLSKMGDHYWSFDGQYPGIDSKTWQPGQPEISFDAIEGKVQLELQGTVPQNFVESKSLSGDLLHNSKPIDLLSLSLASGKVLEVRSQEVIDKQIETYRNLLQTRENLLNQIPADPSYSGMVKAIIDNSKAISGYGYVDQATKMLQAIPESGWVVPQSSKSYYQWIVIGILVIAAALLLLLLMKSRSSLSFARKGADDQARKLEIISARARSIGDTKLAGEIQKVKEDLEQVSGR